MDFPPDLENGPDPVADETVYWEHEMLEPYDTGEDDPMEQYLWNRDPGDETDARG